MSEKNYRVRTTDLTYEVSNKLQGLYFRYIIFYYQTKLLHLASLQKMCSLFFSFDHPNYARYSTLYLVIMLNLENSHPGAEELLKRNGFSVNRSDVPSSRNDADITIKQTINRHAKSHGGIVGFSRNHSAYYRWCRTRHSRASYLQATKDIASMDSQEATSHKEVGGSQTVKSEQDTCSVLQAIGNFTNPFTIEDKDALYCLSFGALVPQDVESDIMMADDIGKKAHREFVQKRLVEENHLSLSSKETESPNVCYQSKIINGRRKGKKKLRNNSRKKRL